MYRLGKFIQRGGLPLILIALIFISACTGLSGEPEIVSTLPPRATLPPVGDVPADVDVALGAQIYAEKCTRCHGIGGAGDGEFVEQLPVKLINFTDPQAVSGKTPQDWYRIIYFGRQENLMPAWGVVSQVSPDKPPLTQDEVWAVTMFLFTFSSGETVEPITTPDADVTEESTSASIDATQAPESTSEVDIEATPNPDATQDVALEPITTPDAEATLLPDATSFVDVGVITGTVTSGTSGSVVPPDLPVTLYMYGDTNAVEIGKTTLSTDATFQFDAVPMSHGEEFYVTVAYLGGFFVSEVLTPDSGTNTLDLPVTIYDLTYDPQAIRVTNILTYANVLEDGTLDVVQVIEFANITDKLYVQVADDVVSSLMVGLPEGAIFNDVTGGRFKLSEDGRTVTDSRPVFPQSAQETAHTLHFAYSIPYDGDVTIEQTFPYLVEGELDVLIQQDGLSVDGDGFQSRGSKMISEGVFADFGATLSLMPQTPIVFSVRGTVIPEETETTTSSSSPNLPIAIALVGAGVLSIALAGFIYIKDRREAKSSPSSTDTKAEINNLMKQIADLDIQHKEGKIAEGEYHKKRDALKSRLTQLMKDQKP